MWAKSYHKAEITSLEKRFRTALLNTSSGIRTAFLAITQGEHGWNTAVLSNITHVGAHPAQMSILFRPDNGQRHTLDHYRRTGIVTLAALPYEAALLVHGTSASYPENTCEWTALGGELSHPEGWTHPVPKEALWAVELQWLEHFELSNGCLYTVGEVQRLGYTEAALPSAKGEVVASNALLAQGLMSYLKAVEPLSLEYAKVP